MCIELCLSLNDKFPAPAPDNWKVGRKAIVAAFYDNVWYVHLLDQLTDKIGSLKGIVPWQ